MDVCGVDDDGGVWGTSMSMVTSMTEQKQTGLSVSHEDTGAVDRLT
jgi:hypothetical protein